MIFEIFERTLGTGALSDIPPAFECAIWPVLCDVFSFGFRQHTSGYLNCIFNNVFLCSGYKMGVKQMDSNNGAGRVRLSYSRLQCEKILIAVI